MPLREAYYTRFDGLNLPENVIAYPQRILPWGVTRPWESLEGYLKGLRAYKKYQPWFEERLPIKRLEDRKDIPLMAFLDTRRKLRQGDIFFVKNTIQDGVIYHIKDDVIEDMRILSEPAEAFDRYCEHVLLGKEGRFDFLPYTSPFEA